MIEARPSRHNVHPIEFEGIRYQQAYENLTPECPGARGFLEAIDIKTETRLWYVQVYNYYAKDPAFETTAHEPEFLRFKLRAAARELLVENEIRGKFFVNIDTQEIREATAADFPPKIKRGPPPDVPPIELNGLRYAQHIDKLNGMLGGPCGELRCIDLKTEKGQWRRVIYRVPFNYEIEDDTQECYFTRMVLLPGEKDILIENEAGDKYLFNIKRCETRPLTVVEADYQPESEPDKISILQRMQAALL